MADNGDNPKHKDGAGDINLIEAVKGLLLVGTAISGAAKLKNSSDKKKEKEQLQRRLSEINNRLLQIKGGFFKECWYLDEIEALEAEKKKILQRLQELG